MDFASSPTDLAALWRLGLLDAADVAAACLRWLEQDLDQGDPDIAALGAEPGLVLSDVASRFDRILVRLGAPPPSEDEALPRGLRIYLAAALAETDESSQLDAASRLLWAFKNRTTRRLVINPGRASDALHDRYAEEELGLEYLYGLIILLDESLAGELSVDDPRAVEAELRHDLRAEIGVLHAHLVSTGV